MLIPTNTGQGEMPMKTVVMALCAASFGLSLIEAVGCHDDFITIGRRL
jgi:hypothetical protein